MEEVNKELILVEGIVKWSRIIEVLKATQGKCHLDATVYKDEFGCIVINTCLPERKFRAPEIKENIWKK